jgi:hypothetical protein
MEDRRRFGFGGSAALFCVVLLSFLILARFQHNKTSKTNENNNPFLIREIWLILPVVICLFQGLSHACLRITAFAGICAWLITSDVIYRKNVAGDREIGYLGEKSS